MKRAFLLGVCPIGKVLFDEQDTLRQKREVYRKLDELKIPYATVECAVENGIIRTAEQIGPAVACLKQAGVDALFIPHCNFGTEGAAGQIAREMGLPTLLWAPRDDAPLSDGSRLRDSLCGCFATGRVLRLMNVRFDYIENCRVDDAPFARGLDRFVRAARGVKALKSARVGMLGNRVPFFWCTINDEAMMLNRFGGSVQILDMVEFLEKLDRETEKNRKLYQAELGEMTWLEREGIPEEGLIKSLAMRNLLLEMAESYGLDAYAIQFFDALQEHIGPGAGLGLALLEDRIACTAETDVTGAFSSVLLENIGDGPCFFPEFVVRHPRYDNRVCLWHASAPLSLRSEDSDPVSVREPWILKGAPATSLQFRLKDGPVTLARLDGINGAYTLGFGEGRTLPGPRTREVYGWLEVADWPAWEKSMIAGGFIHHISGVYGHCADALELASEFLDVPTVRFDHNAAGRN